MLTNSQLTTVLAAVTANSTANGYRTAGDTASLLQWLNGAANPAQLAWSSSMAGADLDAGVSSYTTYDTLSQGKRDEWRIFLDYAPRDMSKGPNRKVVQDVWGTITAGSVGESVLQACTFDATNAQVAIGGNSASLGTVTALNLHFDGECDQTDANWLVNH
jgi:hypothetical protein